MSNYTHFNLSYDDAGVAWLSMDAAQANDCVEGREQAQAMVRRFLLSHVSQHT